MMKLIVTVDKFANVHSDENFGQCHCLCGICNKTYFVPKFYVNTNTIFMEFLIQCVQVKGMLHNVGGGVRLGCGPI